MGKGLVNSSSNIKLFIGNMQMGGKASDCGQFCN